MVEVESGKIDSGRGREGQDVIPGPCQEIGGVKRVVDGGAKRRDGCGKIDSGKKVVEGGGEERREGPNGPRREQGW